MKKQQHAKDTYIVTVGASAGGLEAIHAFFDNMPENSHLCFVVIQHLSSDFKSLLVELLAKHTYMQVKEATQDMAVERDCVYVIPNNKMMTIAEGRLQLAGKTGKKEPNTAIDIFLHSLAKDKGPLGIAVILSGTGTDGTKGALAVKEAGGIVFVQDPATARFNGMPNSVISSGVADYTLPPEQMPEEIHNYISDLPAYVFSAAKIEDDLLKEVYALVYKHCGHDFQFYKPPTLIRRLVRRMTLGEFKDLKTYVEYLQTHPGECKQLYKDFLIHVTGFFRDPAAFDALYNDVFPTIFRTKADHEMVKVWVAACSTGEEAYSIAMLLDKYLHKNGRSPDVKIFATDVDKDAVETAGRGVYTAEQVRDIPQGVLTKYFVQDGNRYTVISRIRKQIVFARHNILRDPPFIRNDLVTCRNMLIYMGIPLQRKVLSFLHFGLFTGGYLMLGSSENVDGIRAGLEDVNTKWKIYRKNTALKGYHQENAPDLTQATLTKLPTTAPQPATGNSRAAQDLLDDFKTALVEDAGFAGLYIDRNYELREAVGNFNHYLSLPGKKLQLNLLKMVGPDLSVALNTAIRKAWKEQQKISLPRVKIRREDGEQLVSILVDPLSGRTNGNNYTFILLGEGREVMNGHNTGTIDFSDVTHSESSRQLLVLETELNETRENLKTVMESYEAANEELQSSNEELLSANEELQSSNEELQSLNEELHTLNTEHQLKIRELVELNDDLNNYFLSTNIGQLFLDANMNIRKFNPAAVHLINLIESDIGRPVSHISTNIKDDHLIHDAQEVQHNGGVVEKEITLQNGEVTLVRILPYVRQDQRTDGVVITFVDISPIKRLDNILEGIFNSSQSAILAFRAVRGQDHKITDLQLITANDAATAVLRQPKADVMHQGMLQHFAHLGAHGLFARYVHTVNTGEVLQHELPVDDDGATRWYSVVAVKMEDGMVATYTDITGKKENEERLRHNYNELVVARENMKKLNAALETKVIERTRELSRAEEEAQNSGEEKRFIAESMPLIVWTITPDGLLTYINHQFTDFTGLRLQEGSVPDWSLFVHPDDVEELETQWQYAFQHKEDFSRELRIRDAEGHYAWFLLRANARKDEHGNVQLWVCTNIDIDEQKQANQILETRVRERTKALQISNDQLEQSNMELQHYAYVASHDLKEPLRKISMFSHMLKDKHLQLLDARALDYMDRIIRSSTRMMRLIDDLLAFSKISVYDYYEHTDLNKLIREILSDLELAIVEKKAVVEFDPLPEIEAIPGQMRQVFQNLISNALKFSHPEKPPVIRITSRRVAGKNFHAPAARNGAWCLITVTDNGIGFDEKYVEKIFTLFQRLHTKDYDGTGIGLAVARKIITKHNGLITAQSKEGEGARFQLLLPVRQEEKGS